MSRIKEKRLLAEKLSAARRELDSLKNRLDSAYRAFNQGTDPELLEACILEISALHSRYSAALRNIKSMDGDKIKWRLQ